MRQFRSLERSKAKVCDGFAVWNARRLKCATVSQFRMLGASRSSRSPIAEKINFRSLAKTDAVYQQVLEQNVRFFAPEKGCASRKHFCDSFANLTSESLNLDQKLNFATVS